MRFSIYRFQPEKDARPFMQNYDLPIAEGQNGMLLDALIALKVQDPTLSFRRSCREGVCGSDGMNINGKNGLACITPLSHLKSPVVVRPLPGLPVIRDLIVDLEPFYNQYKKVKPWLMNDAQVPANKERLQTPEERKKLDGLYECILCACCSTACPSWWWNPDKFLGPAALLWLCRFLLDNRDRASDSRFELVEGVWELFRCKTIMSCVSVCPKGLNPTKAIGVIRNKMIAEQV